MGTNITDAEINAATTNTGPGELEDPYKYTVDDYASLDTINLPEYICSAYSGTPVPCKLINL